jgi:PAS domain S-box-containing protein
MSTAVEPDPGRDPAPELFSAVVDAAPDGVLIVDAGGTICFANPRAGAIFGAAAAELVGGAVDDLLPDAYRSGHAAHRARYLADPHPRPMGTGLELRARRRDGSELPVDISLSPLATDQGMRVIALVRDASDRVEHERHRARLAAIVESSDHAIFSQDLDGLITSWNQAATRLFGHEAAEVVGQRITDVLPGAIAWEDLHAKSAAGEVVQVSDVEVRRKDGGAIRIALTKAPVRSSSGQVVGISATARDVTEQMLALEALGEFAARLDENEALAHIGSWSLDRRGEEVQWSGELHRIAAIHPRDFPGTLTGALELVHPEDRERVERALRVALAAGEPYSDELRLVRPDGSIRWVHMRAEPVSSRDGEPLGLRGICQDVTAQRAVQDAMLDAVERERAAAAELRAADLVKDEFLSTVSHELRTPLTSILGFASLLEADGTTRPELVAPILRNANEMLRMIERLLDFTRIQAGMVDDRPVTVHLADELERALDALERLVADHVLHLEVDSDLVVRVDPVALDRILGNLVGNAVKFSPAGSEICVAAQREAADVVVRVRDRGPGVGVEHRDRIFDRFVQAPEQPAGRRGTGIGLAIVKRHVELAGGRVWCEDVAGGGACFSFTLPVADEAGGAGGAPT